MKNRDWHLICYDIRKPARLRRVHRRLRKNGLAAQRSVFFFNGDKHALDTLLEQLTALMDPRVDDLRAYPVDHPERVWSYGDIDHPGLILTPPRPQPGKHPATPSPLLQLVNRLIGRSTATTQPANRRPTK